MEKKNTLLLTVIAVATLLVAVVGATFAYFSSVQTINATTNVSATVGNSSSEFISTGDEISITVPAANMVKEQKGYWSTSSNGTLAVEFTADNMTCSYDIVFAWDANKAYNPATTTNRAEGHDDDLEFTYQITEGASNVITAETNFTLAGGTYGHDSITSSGQKVTKTYTIDVKFYNIDAVQDGHGNKTYSGKFKVDNVDCGTVAA